MRSALPEQTASTTLYSFCLETGCADGEGPGGLAQGLNGDFYGITAGSDEPNAANGSSLGTVFKISPAGGLKTLYSFCAQAGCPDGESPNGLVQAGNGELYGTTQNGGVNPGPLNTGGGTIFEISPAGKLTTLYSFCAQSSCQDGAYPNAGLVLTANGDLYGTTFQGGANTFGTVFKFTPGGTLATVYNFCSVGACLDGQYPIGGLVPGANGDLYGTTWEGGGITGDLYSIGTVFKITPAGALTTLHAFCATGDCRTAHIPLAPYWHPPTETYTALPWAAGCTTVTIVFPNIPAAVRSSKLPRMAHSRRFTTSVPKQTAQMACSPARRS